MICPKCEFAQADGTKECLRCGIIIARYKPFPTEDLPSEPPTSRSTGARKKRRSKLLEGIRGIFFAVEPGANPFFLAGRALVFVGLGVWGWKFLTTPMETNYVSASFMHDINLQFHEAGPIVFSPFGSFMHSLGGSLGQIVMPCICMVVFLINTRDPFGASVALLWVGQNLMDIAPYINDARALELILLGGVSGKDVEGHDWEYLLSTLDWLHFDHTIALASYRLGSLLMILALVWGAYMLHLQFKHR